MDKIANFEIKPQSLN